MASDYAASLAAAPPRPPRLPRVRSASGTVHERWDARGGDREGQTLCGRPASGPSVVAPVTCGGCRRTMGHGR